MQVSRRPSRVIPPWNDSVTVWDDMSYESVIVNGRDESLRPGQGVVAHKGCEIIVATAGWGNGRTFWPLWPWRSVSEVAIFTRCFGMFPALLTGRIPRCHARGSPRHEAQLPALKNLVAWSRLVCVFRRGDVWPGDRDADEAIHTLCQICDG